MDISQMAAQCRDLQARAAAAELSRRDAETAGMLRAEATGIEKQLKAAGYDLHSLVVL
jgi:endonuclease III